MPNIFDLNAISETVYSDPIPMEWVSPPPGEYPLQCTKVELREVEGRRVAGTFVFAEITWEIIDDEVRRTTNMEHPTARQSFSLNMITDSSGNATNRLDFGVNQNMPLKQVWEACNITKDRTLSKIRHQTVWGRIIHEVMEERDGTPMTDLTGKPMMRATVTRVTRLEEGRRRHAARGNGAAG